MWYHGKSGAKIVEIDKSKFGKRKYNVGRVVEGQWVFGGICRESRDFFMIPVDDRTSATLLSVIKDYIEPGTTIISDWWKAYDCLASEGYKHFKVNHKVNFVDPDTGAHTNQIRAALAGRQKPCPQIRPYESTFRWVFGRCIS